MSEAQISAALEQHCRFLAYVRVNALLHDCDKNFAQFLLWSLKHSEAPNYDEHNKSTEIGKPSVKRKEYLQYWQNDVVKTTEDLSSGYIFFLRLAIILLIVIQSKKIRKKSRKSL